MRGGGDSHADGQDRGQRDHNHLDRDARTAPLGQDSRGQQPGDRRPTRRVGDEGEGVGERHLYRRGDRDGDAEAGQHDGGGQHPAAGHGSNR